MVFFKDTGDVTVFSSWTLESFLTYFHNLMVKFEGVREFNSNNLLYKVG